MVYSRKGPDEVASGELQQRNSPDGETESKQQIHDDRIHASESQEGIIPPIISERPSQQSDTGARILQLDREGSISSTLPGEVSQTPGSGSHVLQSGQEGRNSSIIREKVTEDGYHWRKYGQKLVKGNEFIRSYYKCTHSSCQVKKQLECSRDGKIADIIYFGQHDHPKPQLNLPVAVGFVLSVVEDKADKTSLTRVEEVQAPQIIESTNASQISTVTSSEHVKRVPSESNRIRDEVDNDDDPRSKRQKKGNRNVDPTPVDKPTGEARLVVQTLSDVDIVNDGYRWRKYGQKMVKGNPNPRSYYRCSSPGCPVKKHVERASHDPKVVITSYEGQHDHDIPPSRTVTHNTTGLNSCTTAIPNGELGLKSGESNAASVNGVVYNSLGSSGISKEQLNGESRCKPNGSNATGLIMDIHSSTGHESKSNEHQNGISSAAGKCDATVLCFVANTNSVSEGESYEHRNGESRTEAKENDTGCGVHTIAPGPKGNLKEECISKSEPVLS